MSLTSATGARVGREVTYGTAVPPQVTIPLSGDPAFNVIHEAIIDSGRRDSVAAMDFDAYQGVGRSDVSLEGMFYPEELGFILDAIMGAAASAEPSTATTPKTYNHVFKLAAAGPSYTWEFAQHG